jgi:hypothetical protein
MRLVRVAATAVASVAVLAGCSDGGTANETLPSTSTSAAETSESLSPLGPPDLPMPAEAREQTAEGFSSFADYYISLINRLQGNLDSTYLRQFSRNCETCDRLASDADSDARKHFRYDGGTISITAIAPSSLTEAQAEVAFTVNQAAYSVLDESGQQVAGLAGEAAAGLPAGMQGVWSSDHWVVTNLSFG